MNTWYLRRLRTMSLPEIPFRIRQYIQKHYEKYTVNRKMSFSILEVCKKNFFNADFISYELYPEKINVFGEEFKYSSKNINWHHDIISGYSFPFTFAKQINIQSNKKASAKIVWEINRLQFLLFIALNIKKTGSDYYINQFINVLTSWIDNNPYLLGINWHSNIEVNIRLITWFLCWEILDIDILVEQKREFGDFIEAKWLPSIYQHCQYSFKNPSKFSSSNNHLIAEYAGLFIASSRWKFKESAKWIKYSKTGLEKEIQRQHSSGINKEEAAEYIQFITDFFLLAFIVGENSNNPFSEEYKRTLYSILIFINNFLDSNGNFPNYGDEDDGRCFIIDVNNKFNNFKSLLTSGVILFKDPFFKSKSNGFDIKNQFLFGKKGKVIFESFQEKKILENSKFYNKEGHFILRKQEMGSEIYMHFDAAPLGYLSIAAHGHADALSFILRLNGDPVFVDSGTYTYHDEPEWRKYFIGTLAHNTIRINKKDQALNRGATLWLKHYKSRLIYQEQDEVKDHIKATHNGYKKENAHHVREIIFDRKKNEFHISDNLIIKGSKKVQIEIPFHFHPDVMITNQEPNCFILSMRNNSKALFIVDETLSPIIIKGQKVPQILGWYSESFLQKIPTNVIYCKEIIDTNSTFKFIIKIL